MAQADFFPLVASLVGSTSRELGIALHFLIAFVIGASFGLLFQRDVRGAGSSLGWGLAYGLLWWFIGPLTLLPLLRLGAAGPADRGARGAAAPAGGYASASAVAVRARGGDAAASALAVNPMAIIARSRIVPFATFLSRSVGCANAAMPL
jgi:hypothetical protein